MSASEPPIVPLMGICALTDVWHGLDGPAAILIVDQNEEPVGWATDMTGTVDQSSAPIGRTSEAIRLNAYLMAEAPKMAQACVLLSRGMHLLEVRTARAGIEIHAEVRHATEIARAALARIEAGRTCRPHPNTPTNDNGAV